jgi:hypothetical protein
MNRVDHITIVIDSFNDVNGFDVEHTCELMELYDVTPLDLARCHTLDSSIFDVKSLVKVTMEWSYELCHSQHGY